MAGKPDGEQAVWPASWLAVLLAGEHDGQQSGWQTIRLARWQTLKMAGLNACNIAVWQACVLLIRLDIQQASCPAILTASRLASKQSSQPYVRTSSRCHVQKTIAADRELLQQGGQQAGLQS